MTNFNTYAAAEKNLQQQGFKFEFGMPLYGVRFFNGIEYRFVLRIADGNYEIIKPKAA